MKLQAALIALALCAGNTLARAQESGLPKGPADVMNQAARAREKQKPKPLQQGATPATQTGGPGVSPGHPQPAPAAVKQGELPTSGHEDSVTGQPAGQQPAAAVPPGHPEASDAAPVGNDPHANMEGAPPLARRPLTSGEPSAQLPAGTIRLRVLDASEHPVANADVQLGSMSQAGRNQQPGRTNEQGVALFEKLATGDKQAYRVNVLYQGAKYSSMPFRLPPDQGFEVVIRRLETTTDPRDVVLYVGATSLELRDERLKVVQQARLVNIGSKTYVFPEQGTLVKLPADLMAFQAEEIMTDQRVREEKGQGVRINGSVPPGEVTLTWGFDVPQTDTEASFAFELPWLTFAYRVLADAAPGMQLEVEGMPPAELHEDAGRRFYVTEIVKRVGEQPLKAVRIKLKGIPGPGPQRFVAVGLALLVIGLGVLIARKSLAASGGKTLALAELELEQERLVARARELEAEHARGDIGPEFHKNALHELEEQLSGVLYERERLARLVSKAS